MTFPRNLGFGLLAALLPSCGQQTELSQSSLTEVTTSIVADVDQELHLTEGEASPSFVIQFHIMVDGCASGLRAQGVAAETLKLYRSDLGCKGKLTQFHIENEAYYLADANARFEQGDRVTFRTEDGSKERTVLVAKQLESPLNANAELSFKVLGITQDLGSWQVLQFKRGQSERIRQCNNRNRMPNYKIQQATILAESPSSQSFRVSFLVECGQPIRRQGRRVPSCYGSAMNDLQYVLVKDTVHDRPCDETSPSRCNSFFRSDVHYVNACSEIIYPGEQGLVNGGFVTTLKVDQALMTPSNTAANNQMLLILRNRFGFQYFNVDLQVASRVVTN